MSAQPSSTLFLHDHPVSSYTQKVRIALREKGLPFERAVPAGIGSGQDVPSLAPANPRLQVPALEDGDVKIFDSTIILAYLEDKFPEHRLMPEGAAARAKARMIEDVCDNQYEAINWGYGELEWFERATGELREKLVHQVQHQAATMENWLSEQLGEKPYFNGDSFGYADVCAAPMVNRSVLYGYGPAEGTALQKWHARIQERESVRVTFEEMEEAVKGLMGGGLKARFEDGGFRREYRDHRLEWMVKSGGIEIVLEGLKKNNIRFTWPEPA